jgi:hypothetical protein
MAETTCSRGCTCTRCQRNRTAFAQVMAERAEANSQLAAALNTWRWCWDCAATKQTCDEARMEDPPRKCCPDCRHRNAKDARVNWLTTEDG